MSIGKQGAHVSQAVDVGCLGLGVSAEATDPVVQVVDGDKQDVRLPLGPEGKAWEGKKEGEEKAGWFHKMELNQGCLACLRMVSRFCLMSLVFSAATLSASAKGLPLRMGRLCPISVNQASRFARMRSCRNIIMRS